MAPQKIRMILVKTKVLGHGTLWWLPGVKGGRELDYGGGQHERIFLVDDGTVLCLNCGGFHQTYRICQKSHSVFFKNGREKENNK